MENIYRKNIIDHYKNPRNYGKIKNPDFSFEKENPFCGDKIRIEIKKEPKKKIIKEIRFSGKGCAISIASASLLTEYIKGKTIKEVEKISLEKLLSGIIKVKLTPIRIKCAELPLLVLKKALKKD